MPCSLQTVGGIWSAGSKNHSDAVLPRKKPNVNEEVFAADWLSGMPLMWLAEKHDISRDTATSIRDRLGLPKRHDRKKRYKPPRHKDPTPSEIKSACEKIRAKWDSKTESERRVVKVVQWTLPEYDIPLEDYEDEDGTRENT